MHGIKGLIGTIKTLSNISFFGHQVSCQRELFVLKIRIANDTKSVRKFIFLQSQSVDIQMKWSVLHACVVIILFFPLLAWPSLQPSPPWWTTMSATTTWALWSPSRYIHHRRSPRPGTRRSPATCWGRKTSQGRFLAASSLRNRSSSHTFSSYNCVPAMIICDTLPGVNANSSGFVVVLRSDSRIAEGPDWRSSCLFPIFLLPAYCCGL